MEANNGILLGFGSLFFVTVISMLSIWWFW